MKLNDITNYIQNICQNISTVLDVDVTVVSKDLIRIAGTGIFENKVSEKISDNSAYSKIQLENLIFLNVNRKTVAKFVSIIKTAKSWQIFAHQ